MCEEYGHRQMMSQASNQIVTILGRNIAHARAAAGHTQRSLAIEMGLDIRAINRWERAGITPRRGHLVKLGELLGRDAGWFYTEHPDVDYSIERSAA